MSIPIRQNDSPQVRDGDETEGIHAGPSKTAKRKPRRSRAKARKNEVLEASGTVHENVIEDGSWDTRLPEITPTASDIAPLHENAIEDDSWDTRLLEITPTASDIAPLHENAIEDGSWDRRLPQITSVVSNFAPELGEYISTTGGICREICAIKEMLMSYLCGRSDLLTFVLNMIDHGYNLYVILRNDGKKMVDSLKMFIERLVRTDTFMRPAIQGTATLNETNEDSSETDPSDDDASTSDADLTEENKAIYEIILDLVVERVNQMCSISNTTEEILEMFTEILLSISEQITSKIHKDYEEMLAFNYKTIGVEKTKVVLAKIGINSRKDFANKKFPEIFNKFKFHSAPPPNPLAPKPITKEVLALYHDLFLVLSDDNEFASNAEETAKMLNRSVSIVMKPLIEKFTFGKTYYENNASYFGADSGKAMLIAALDLDPRTYVQKTPNDVMFVQIARQQINVSQAAADFVQKIEEDDCVCEIPE